MIVEAHLPKKHGDDWHGPEWECLDSIEYLGFSYFVT